MVYYEPDSVYVPGSDYHGDASISDYVSVVGLAYVSHADIQDILDLFFTITRRRHPTTPSSTLGEEWTSLLMRGPFKTLVTVDDEPYQLTFRRYTTEGGDTVVFLGTVDNHFVREHGLPRNPAFPLVIDASGSIYAAEDLWIQVPVGSENRVLDKVYETICNHLANKKRLASLAATRQQQDSDAQIGGDVDEDEGMKQIKEELIEVTESAEEVEVKKEEEPDEEDN